MECFPTAAGNDFLALRTVDTSSFLIPSAHGRGYGKQMRAAVLAGLRTPARTGGHHLSLARQPRVAGRLPRAAVVTVTADGVRLSSAIDVLLPNIRWDES